MNKYEQIIQQINDNKIDMTKLYMYSCFSKEKIMQKLDYAYDMWLEIDNDICVARLCDIVEEHWQEIQEDKFDYEDLISELFS